MTALGFPARRRRGLALILGVSLVAIGATGCGDLSREELNRGVESLSALAAQGELDRQRCRPRRDQVHLHAGDGEDARRRSRARGRKARRRRTVARGEERAQTQPCRSPAELADLFSELQTFPGDERHGARSQSRCAKSKNRPTRSSNA